MMLNNHQMLGAAVLLMSAPVMAQFACIQVVTTTIALQPPLIAHTTGATCPTSYISVDGRGVCCTAAGTARYSGASIACCPCGAFCTGDFVAAQTWNENAVTSLGPVGPVTAPITVTQVSSGGASASTVVATYSPSTSSGSVTIISGTASPSSMAMASTTRNSTSIGGTMQTSVTTPSTGIMPTSTGGPVTGGTSGAEAEFLLSPATFISGAFVALFCARALWVW